MSKNELAVAMVVGPETAVKLFEQDEFDTIFSQIQKMVKAQKADTSTAAGRAEIRSLSAKITRTKTAITGMGKDLTEDWRKKTAKVNEKRGEFESRLKALAATARKPLDDWEAAEEKRKSALAEGMQKINGLQTLTFDVSSATIKYNLAELQKLMSDFDFQESQDTADVMADAAKVTLETALKQVEAKEAMEAEHARLQAEQARRDKEASDKLAKQQAEFDALKAKSDAAIAAAKAETAIAAAKAETAAMELKKNKVLEEARADDAEAAKLQALKTEEEKLIADGLASKPTGLAGGALVPTQDAIADDGDPLSKHGMSEVQDDIETVMTAVGLSNIDAMAFDLLLVAITQAIINGEIRHVSIDF